MMFSHTLTHPSLLPPSLPPSLPRPQAQQIDRVLQAFATAAFEQCAEGAKGGASVLASVDVAYLLSFSVIMLNTGTSSLPPSLPFLPRCWRNSRYESFSFISSLLLIKASLPPSFPPSLPPSPPSRPA